MTMEADSDKLSYKTAISVGRVSTIMKSSSDVEIVSKGSALVMSKAVELFINMLTEEGFHEMVTSRKLEYWCLSNVVHREDKYKFLRDILPKKITVMQYKEIMARKNRKEGQSDGVKGSTIEDSASESSSEEGSNDSSGSVK